jgi:tetratricopeptide (TPR) repeat protein
MTSPFRVAVAVAALLSAAAAQAPPDRSQQIAEQQRKVQESLQQHNADAALAELRKLAELQPGDPDTEGNIGVLLFFKNQCAEAVPHLKAATAARGDLWRIQTLAGLCEQKLGDLSAAQRDLAEAIPHLTDAKIRLEAGVQLADMEVNAGDNEKAATLLDQLRAENPASLPVLYLSYRVHTELANAAMLGMSMVAPDSSEMHQVMAHESMRYGDPTAAIAQYREAIRLNPRISSTHFELAEVLYVSANMEDRKNAEQEYRTALSLNPQDAQSASRLGEIDAEHGNKDQALTEFKRAIELAPGDVNPKLGIANVLIDLNRGDEALSYLQDAVRVEPDNDNAHYMLSRLYWKQGRKEDAQQELALYKKYKAMKSKLQEIYKQMRIAPRPMRLSGTAGGQDEQPK